MPGNHYQHVPHGRFGTVAVVCEIDAVGGRPAGLFHALVHEDVALGGVVGTIIGVFAAECDYGTCFEGVCGIAVELVVEIQGEGVGERFELRRGSGEGEVLELDEDDYHLLFGGFHRRTRHAGQEYQYEAEALHITNINKKSKGRQPHGHRPLDVY